MSRNLMVDEAQKYDPLPAGERVVRELRMQFANRVRGVGGCEGKHPSPAVPMHSHRNGDLSPTGRGGARRGFSLRVGFGGSLFAVALLAVAGWAQPPAKDPVPKAPPAPKAADPLDALIGAALVHDADVKLAQAKLQLAEAEVFRARQQVTQKVAALDSAIREQKKLVATAEMSFKVANDNHRAGNGAFSDVLLAREKLETAQAKLAVSETDLKSLTGGGRAKAIAWADPHGLDLFHNGFAGNASCLACHAAPATVNGGGGFKVAFGTNTTVKGPIADRIRAALDKPVKLGPKDAKVSFRQALDAFKKDAGLDVPVRNDIEMNLYDIVALGEELPVGAWLQLFADASVNARFVVREYGLLITSKDLVPPDAISVNDFWKQRPVEKKEPKTP